MTTELFRLDRLDENPWNERPLDEANVATIAASLESDGLLQNPVGRIHPTDPGRVQLAYGHHRLAAFRRLAAADPANERWQLIPVDVRVIDDKQMARQAIIENHHRQDPSGIEKARALLRLTKEFGETQESAGALFGLGQAGVSHLIRLLKLPAEVQVMVDQHELAERTARSLVPLVDWRPDVVIKIAQGALKVKTEERDEVIENAIGRALRDLAPSLSEYQTPWPMEWPAKPLPVANFDQTKGEPAEVPACKGCRFNLARGQQNHCLRPACYGLKEKIWPAQAVQAAIKKLGIPAAAEGEKVVVIWDGSSYSDDRKNQMIKAVRAKRPELRLVPATKASSRGYELEPVTGSKFVYLAATSRIAVDAWLEESKGKAAKTPVPANETAAQKEKRINAEKELAEERAHERSTFNKAKVDGLYLFDKAAELVAERTAGSGGLLVWACLNALRSYSSQVGELNIARSALGDAAKLGKGAEAHLTEGTPTALDVARRKYIAFAQLVSDVARYDTPAQLFSKFGEMVKGLEREARKQFGVQLPAGWDTVPVHHTAYNCWQCGAFAGNPRGFTKAELAEGWGGDAKAGYHCPVHQPKGRLVNILDTKTNLSPTAAIARSFESNDRGHTRPAPKPSAASTPAKGAASKPVGVSTGKPTRRAAQRAQAAAPAVKKGGRK